MRKYLKSFLRWLLAVVLAAVPLIAGIGCKEHGGHVFWHAVGWLCMAESMAAVVYAVIRSRRNGDGGGE